MLLLSSHKIELIMVTYCRPNDFTQSLQSILNNTSWPYHLSIIDNSYGQLDNILNTISNDNITIYKNHKNLGKGKAFATWYNTIMHNNKSDCFVSIDSDVVVPNNWLELLLIAKEQVQNTQEFGAIAPTLIKNQYIPFNTQLQSKLIDHIKGKRTKPFNHHIYHNNATAGPLLLINKKFYESIGGYSTNQLYGNDDGKICRHAILQNRFIGIVTDLIVQHLDIDTTDGYNNWKLRNINGDIDKKGYWDL